MENGVAIYGQVTGYDGQLLTVRHVAGSSSFPLAQVEEVAPVIAFLLYHSILYRRITTPAAINNAHAKILDRLLGQHGATATRQIRELLSGIVAIGSQPHPTDHVPWINPCSGHDTVCNVGHVIDFGFYTDGDHTRPSGIALGGTFCDDPSVAANPPEPSATIESPHQGPRQPPLVGHPMANDAHVRFVDLMDALDDVKTESAFLPNTVIGNVGPSSRDAQESAPRKRPRNEPQSPEASSSMRILSALTDFPDLLQHYARQLNSLGPERQRPRYTSISDFAPSDETESRTDRQHSFRLSSAQQVVHQAITADEHRGKSPASFIEHAHASRATKFVPHPAIMSRIYDFQFGVCGLSILHFRRFDLSAQLEYASSSQLNLRNFSVKVELPQIPTEPSHEELKTALRILGTYADEFFDSPTRRLLSAAKDFAEELSDFEPWSTIEVKTLSFWFSSVLSAYRLASEYDLDHNPSTRLDVRSRLSMQDPELIGLLLKMSRKRARSGPLPSMGAESSRRDAPEWQANRNGCSSNKSLPRRPMPTEVGLAAPRQGGKQLCLRFISSRGCPSSSVDRCTHPFLGHFVPSTKLDPVVKAHVQEKLGGLRADCFVYDLDSEVTTPGFWRKGW